MFEINIISVIFNTYLFFCVASKYIFNCGSQKISNVEKRLRLARSLATPDIDIKKKISF